jgi:hypothetical protein
MKRLRGHIDLPDVMSVIGLALIAVSLYTIAPWLSGLVVGCLLLALALGIQRAGRGR